MAVREFPALVESDGDPPLGIVGRKIRILTPTITLSPYSV